VRAASLTTWAAVSDRLEGSTPTTALGGSDPQTRRDGTIGPATKRSSVVTGPRETLGRERESSARRPANESFGTNLIAGLDIVLAGSRAHAGACTITAPLERTPRRVSAVGRRGYGRAPK
jgi:hypothetical protein